MHYTLLLTNKALLKEKRMYAILSGLGEIW